MKRILLFVVLLTSLLSSCGDDEITRDAERFGYQYYPLAIGNYWIFNVTENKYVRDAISQTSTYQKREWIDATVTDQTGREWYRVQISRRNTASDAWMVSGVKLISMSSSDLRIQENNQTTVQMIFPVKNGNSFISNAFRNEDHDKPVYYTYADLGSIFTEAGNTYDNTVTLLQGDTDTQLEYQEKYEVYAAGKGPVNRTDKHYFYCDDSTGEQCPYGEEYIVNGTDKLEVLESSGKME
ncbi:hypothetical protein ACFSC6_21360 [Rufibacter sediminis]|uniref:Lipoprotein n=1 Tax=Rufibacter sediminis TaxID=2762756 RepID=A0ABR6VRG0_9BACT|nr:hypothetical protein [Rufibacter sediminis]MBC3539742.1 hypothetical protein [Rufibacter sediminis]